MTTNKVVAIETMADVHAEQAFSQSKTYFDPTGGANNSLYLSFPEEYKDRVNGVIAGMRGRGIWSDKPPAEVKEADKPKYLEQMQFIEAIRLHALEGCFYFTAICADHPNYRFNPQRWSDWKVHLLSRFKS